MNTVMSLPAESLVHIHQEVEINAPVNVAFAALLEQLGPGADEMMESPMRFKLEAWPGGRWYRDLGNNAGHLWGFVQVIKPPTLLEICGPLFMSYAAVSHVQYRLTERGRGTVLSMTHRAMGEMDPEHVKGMTEGWGKWSAAIKARAEG